MWQQIEQQNDDIPENLLSNKQIEDVRSHEIWRHDKMLSYIFFCMWFVNVN